VPEGVPAGITDERGESPRRGRARRWSTRWLTLGLLAGGLPALAAAAVIYGMIGGKDTFEALTFSGKVIGAVIFICAITSFLAVLGAGALLICKLPERPARTCGYLVIVGAATTFTLSVILFAVQLAVGEATPWLWAWGLIAAGSLSLLGFAIVAHLPPPSARGLIGGISLGVLVSLVGVVYTDFYVPSSAVPLLTVSASMASASIDQAAHTATVPISIQIRNQQKIGVYILGSYYDVAGRRGSAYRAATSPLPSVSEDNAAKADQSFGRFFTEDAYDLLQSGPIIPAGDFLNPGESFRFSDTLTIPEPTSYDALQVSFHILIMRDDRFQLGSDYTQSFAPSWDAAEIDVATAPAWVRNGQPAAVHFLSWRGLIQQDSYLLGLIRQPEYVHVWYVLPPLRSAQPYSPQLVGIISPGGYRGAPPTSGQILREINFYGFERDGGGEYVTAATAQLHIPTRS
jgi:hypothetical protein